MPLMLCISTNSTWVPGCVCPVTTPSDLQALDKQRLNYEITTEHFLLYGSQGWSQRAAS